jgi:hypothetical protein
MTIVRFLCRFRRAVAMTCMPLSMIALTGLADTFVVGWRMSGKCLPACQEFYTKSRQYQEIFTTIGNQVLLRFVSGHPIGTPFATVTG